MEAVRTENYLGYTIHIVQDDDPQIPRTEFDNLGTIYTSHRRYQPEEDLNKSFEDEDVWKSHGVFSDKFLKNYIALPIYLYDHSGVTVRTIPFGCPWDSGLFGMIAVSKDVVRQEYDAIKISPKLRQKVENLLREEVKLLDDYYTGNVYGFRIVPEGSDDFSDEIDSCYGFYGYSEIDYMIEESKRVIECHIRNNSVA